MAEKPKKSDVLIEEVYGAEAYATALFWNDPQLFNIYSNDKFNSKMFGNSIWSFYFNLAREMHNRQIAILDDISTYRVCHELGFKKYLDKYGGYETIREVMNEVSNKGENIEAYYAEVKKYNMLRSLRSLFGDKVVQKEGKYDYKKMTKDQLHTYWLDKINRLSFDGDNTFKVDYLLKGLRESVKKWDEEPDIGMEFFGGRNMTKICAGWADGCLYLLGGFGGKGKSSLSFVRVILSCVQKREKLLVIANEQDIEDFKKMLVISAMGNGTEDWFLRGRINEGGFTDEENEKLEKAIKWVEEISGGEKGEGLIAFAYLESYNMHSVKQIVRNFAHRGYKKLMIDTGKPGDDAKDIARWQKFTEDMTELYQLIRPKVGLNIATWVNVQLADNCLNMRYLTEYAFGDSKKIKNEATVVFMFRHIFDDEYADERNALNVTRYVKDGNGGTKEEHFQLDKLDKQGKPIHYALMFTVKNRRGQDQNTGQRVLVMRVDLNRNIWKEIGWTYVTKDFSGF